MNLWTSTVSSCILTLAFLESISSFQVMHQLKTGSVRFQNQIVGKSVFATHTRLFDKVQDNKEVTLEKEKDEKQVETIPSIPILSEKESMLAMDPSTIEVIPIDKLSEEGKVLGGAYSGTDHKAPSAFSENSDSSSLFGFVNMFRGSANYIANHRNTIIVYHIPGELLEWDGFNDLMDDIAYSWLLGMKPVIVAGCRAQINSRMPAGEDGLNEKDGQYDSVRRTDLKTLRIVQEEAGYVRFEIERLLGRSLHRHGMVDDNAVKDGNVVSGNFYSAQPFGKCPCHAIPRFRTGTRTYYEGISLIQGSLITPLYVIIIFCRSHRWR